jgi:hypothetical protein
MYGLSGDQDRLNAVAQSGFRFFVLHRVGSHRQPQFGGRAYDFERHRRGCDYGGLGLGHDIGHLGFAQLHHVLGAAQPVCGDTLVGRVVLAIDGTDQQVATRTTALDFEVRVVQVLDQSVTPSPLDGGVRDALGQAAQVGDAFFPAVGGRQRLHVLKVGRVLNGDVSDFVGGLALIPCHTFVESVVGSQDFGDAERARRLATLLVGGLLQDQSVVVGLEAGGEFFP